MGQKIPELTNSPPDYLVFIHRIFLKDGQTKLGGLDQILSYLRRKGRRILYLEHPLSPNDHPNSYIKLDEKILLKKRVWPPRPPLRWISETVSDINFVRSQLAQPVMALTADPLSSLSALILKKLRKIKNYYFHSIDYSEDRFGNPLLNKIYQLLFLQAANGALKVGVVSQRALEKLTKMGVVKEKILLLPNSPAIEEISGYRQDLSQKNLWQIVVTCAGVEPKFRLEDTLAVFGQLKAKFPQTKLVIIGPTNTDQIYFAKLQVIIKNNGWQESVFFSGFLPKEKNWEIVGQCGVGMAFYNATHSHVKFGDSLKIREYAALGLPTVADNVTATAEEMAKAGAGSIAYNEQEAAEIIAGWWNDQEKYSSVSNAALRWAERNDKDKLVTELYEKVLT